MHNWLIDLLACPDCHGGLSVVSNGGEEWLHCPKCGDFPVIKGIPRLLPSPLLKVYLQEFYPDLATRSNQGGRFTEAALDSGQQVQTRTMFSFGYQWNNFDEDHAAWQREYQRCMGGMLPGHFGPGRLIADIGCGMGRMLYRASGSPGRYVGMDLSNAIESANRLCAERDNVALVQGDILNPPFKDGSFDTIYSVGVLHHLPMGIHAGIARLIPLLKSGGFLHTWLYGRQRGDDAGSMVMKVRHVVRNWPLPYIRIFSYLYAGVVMGFVNLPAALIERIPGGKRVVDRLPFPSWRRMSFRAIACNVFDYYATPVEYGYDRKTLLEEAARHPDIAWQLDPLATPRNPEESWYFYGSKR